MNIAHIRMWIICLIFVELTLSACQSSNTPPKSVETESDDEWQTYANISYKFSFQYPPGWQFKDLSASESVNQQEEIWFTAGELPPQNTDAQPDLTLIIMDENPLEKWEQDYFDEYQSEVIQIGNGTAAKISGVNKESLLTETVVILNLEGIYIQLLPSQSAQALEVFEKILNSFDSVGSPSADILTVEKVTCISPYFDPIAILPGNDKILFRSDSGVMIFNLKTLKEELVLDAPIQLVKAALSPDGKILAWALEDHRIEILELPSGKVLNTLTGHTGMVTAIKFSQAGNKLYTASHDNSIKVWDVDGSLVSEFYPGGGEVLGIGVSPDETKLAVVTFEGPQKLWNLQTNELIRAIETSGAFDGADAGFSPNGQIVGINLGSGQVSLWNVKDGTQLWSGGNYALALSPDGRFIAYSDLDVDGNNLVQIQSMDDQQLVQTLVGHTGLIWKLFFSSDGSMLVSTSNQIRIWQVADGILLHNFVVECP